MKNSFIKHALIAGATIFTVAGVAVFAQTNIETNVFNAWQTIMRTTYTTNGSQNGAILMDINNGTGIYISGALLQNTVAVNGLGVDANGYVTTNVPLGGGQQGPAGPQGPQGATGFSVVTSGDADWYSVTSPGNAPMDINDDIYTYGQVGIGMQNPTVPLQVLGNVIFGSENNVAILSTNSSILGGTGNTIRSGNTVSIGGGSGNTIEHRLGFPEIEGSTIGGGRENRINTNFSFIGGGEKNIIPSGNIGWGTIAGGYGNRNAGQLGFIGGGSENIIDNTLISSIIGGSRNEITQSFGSSIVGGTENKINGQYSSIIGGENNQVTGNLSISFGLNTNISGNNIFLRDPLGVTNGNPTTQNDSFIIHAANGVGINTNAPQKALHVNGAIASSLININTGGTNIDIAAFMANHVDDNLFNTGGNIDLNGVNRNNHINADGTALFIPAFVHTGGTDAFGSQVLSGIEYSGHVTYIVIIDADKINHIHLQPGVGEGFIVIGIKNGVIGQQVNIFQRPIIIREIYDQNQQVVDQIIENRSMILGENALPGFNEIYQTTNYIINQINISVPPERTIFIGQDINYMAAGISLIVDPDFSYFGGATIIYDGSYRNPLSNLSIGG